MACRRHAAVAESEHNLVPLHTCGDRRLTCGRMQVSKNKQAARQLHDILPCCQRCKAQTASDVMQTLCQPDRTGRRQCRSCATLTVSLILGH